MQRFRVDLHIHSRFSRATSTRLNAAHLAAWGRVKGLTVLGTGDFTHPVWRDELRADLVEDPATGLYRLRDPQALRDTLPEYDLPHAPAPLFMLQAEISSIYKKDGAVRKVHNLVYMPDFDSADRLCRKLEAIGNLHADGRPILGLDSRHLLEMVLKTDSRGVVIPAHIWTPWFSLFGSRSGFDSLEACFGDLSHHIFALETGLSSDPGMNRQWSALDRYALVSNSDCHSGENLGREANLFTGAASYDGLFEALRRSARHEPARDDCHFLGTLEFFPEEGKYHLDGHRACNVVLEPDATRKLGGLCPVCGRELTVGVLHRVRALADRDTPVFADHGPSYASLIPLPELLGELLGVGAKTAKVRTRYADLLHRFGDELTLLMDMPEQALRAHWDALGEAVARMRRGEVLRQGGYDGEYGVVRVFRPEEQRDLLGGRIPRARTGRSHPREADADRSGQPHRTAPDQADSEDDPAAAPGASGTGALPIPRQASLLDALGLSMPERTRSKTSTRARTVQAANADIAGKKNATAAPAAALASIPANEVSVTAPAVPATSGTLGTLGTQADPCAVPPVSPVPPTQSTSQPPAQAASAFTIAQLRALRAGPQPVLVLAGPGAGKTRTLIGRLVRLIREGMPPSAMIAVTFTRRAASELRERLLTALEADGMPHDPALLPHADTLHALALRHWPGTPPLLLGEEAARAAFASANPDISGPDLHLWWERLNLGRERMQQPEGLGATLLENYSVWKETRQQADYTDLLEVWLTALARGEAVQPWAAVLVDEIQDLSPLQLALLRALLPPDGRGFFGIGDPDQAIYGFRGAHPDVAGALGTIWSQLEVYTLSDSHRSGPGILEAASCVLGATGYSGGVGTRLHAARPLPSTLHLFAAPDAFKEARWIADRAAGLIGWGGHTELDHAPDATLPSGPCSPGDLAILVRTRALMPLIRDALSRRGIPCVSPEAAPFWSDPGIAILLTLAARHFDVSLQQARALYLARPLPDPAPTVPSAYWEGDPRRLAPLLEGYPQLSTLTDTPALHALYTAWRDYQGWPGLLDVVHLGQATDLLRARAEHVQLMTLHAAKGLEFRAIFLPGLEDGLLPFFGSNALMHPDQPRDRSAELTIIAEERRLLYVGITRAAEAVFASHAARRTLYGRELSLPPSRLLHNLPASFATSTLVRRTKMEVRQMSFLE